MGRTRVGALTVLLLTASATGTAVAPTIVFSRQDVVSFAGARSIVAGDFDRDGWIDLAHANAGLNSVTVLLNQGNGSSGFARTSDVPVGPGPFDLASGDFNQDGVLDLAVTHGSGRTISILRGTTTGGFTRTDLPVPQGPRGILATDFNKDGRLDLIVTGWDSNAIQILLGNGNGGFANGGVVSSIASRPQGIGVADFNKDGHLDLAVAHESGNGLVILTGKAGAIVQARSIAGMANLNVLTTGDFNRDGWPDVAAASSSGNRVGVYLGSASGPRFHRAYPTGASPRGIATRDINYDGLLDIVTVNRDGDSVSVLLGDPASPGTFDATDSFAAGAGSRAIATEDFDWDGRLDLATGNQDAATATVLWNETLFDRAAFTFNRLSFGTPSNAVGGSDPVPADFNEDGKLDVVVTPDFTVGRVVQVLLTDGPTVNLPFQQFVGGFVVDDFNRDGHMDVILVEGGQSGILLPYLGNGRGGFTRAAQTSIPNLSFAIAVGDLNADAAPDLAFPLLDTSTGGYAVQVLVGRGDGTFATGSRVNTSDFTSAVTLADQNRDGKMDVLAFVRGTLTVFRGDGIGNLAVGTATTFSNAFTQELAVGDLNRDGLLDAVAGEQTRVSVSLGDGSGFPAPSVIEVRGFSNNSNVVLSDINLDGKLDIVGSSGYIMRGHGDGTFEPPEDFDWDGYKIHVVDFTRDGLPDVVVPTTNGAFDVIVNERNSVNHAPTVECRPRSNVRDTQTSSSNILLASSRSAPTPTCTCSNTSGAIRAASSSRWIESFRFAGSRTEPTPLPSRFATAAAAAAPTRSASRSRRQRRSWSGPPAGSTTGHSRWCRTRPRRTASAATIATSGARRSRRQYRSPRIESCWVSSLIRRRATNCGCGSRQTITTGATTPSGCSSPMPLMQTGTPSTGPARPRDSRSTSRSVSTAASRVGGGRTMVGERRT